MFKKTTILAALILLPAGCGGDDGTDNVQYGASLTPEEPREVRHEGLADSDYGDLDRADVGLHIRWGRNLITRDATPDAAVVRLTDVAVDAMEGFDRVTFTFEPRVAGYRVELVEEGGGGCDGSEPGTEAPRQLAVEFPSAVSNSGGTPLVGDRDRTLDLPTLSRAVQTCDAGDKVRWLFGTAGDTEYRLLEVSMGHLLVVDLRDVAADADVTDGGEPR